MIYISDHGENVYDHGEKAGHDYSKVVPKANVEIPFFLWVSSYFQSLDSSKTQQAILNKNKPFVTDDLFHALIDLNFIKTNFCSIFLSGSFFMKNKTLYFFSPVTP